MQLAAIDLSDDFMEALTHFIKFRELPWTVEPFDAKKQYRLADPILLLAHNHRPEDMKLAAKVFSLRNSPHLCALPLIFLSEPLAPNLLKIYEEKEFIWTLPLPFNSAHFFTLIQTVEEFKDKNQDLLNLRLAIQVAISKTDYEEASSLLKKMDANYASAFPILLVRSLIALGLGKLNAAESYLEKACELKPDSFEANSQLAKVYHLRKKTEEFKRTLARIGNSGEIYVQNLIHWGNIYMERGEAEKSQSAFEKAVAKDNENLDAKEGLLAANLLNGNIEMAQAIMDGSPNAFELARLCNLKGIAMAKSGNYRAAETLYRNAIKFMPNDDSVYKLWFNLGLCFKMKKDLKKALVYFEKAQKEAHGDFSKAAQQIHELKNSFALSAGTKKV